MAPRPRGLGLLARLTAKIDVSGGPDACHPWTGALSRGRGREALYGSIQEAGRGSKVWRVNRLVLLLLDLPEEAFRAPEAEFLRWLRMADHTRAHLEGAHGCDNSRCANAQHLEWQDHGRNVAEQTERRAAQREARA